VITRQALALWVSVFPAIISDGFYLISNKIVIGSFISCAMFCSLDLTASPGDSELKTCAVIGFYAFLVKYKSGYFFVEYAELRVLPFDAVVENKQYAGSREILTF
jgi:hypothetical protein